MRRKSILTIHIPIGGYHPLLQFALPHLEISIKRSLLRKICFGGGGREGKGREGKGREGNTLCLRYPGSLPCVNGAPGSLRITPSPPASTTS